MIGSKVHDGTNALAVEIGHLVARPEVIEAVHLHEGQVSRQQAWQERPGRYVVPGMDGQRWRFPRWGGSRWASAVG